MGSSLGQKRCAKGLIYDHHIEASDDGCDGCLLTFGAENTALATFTDRIIFYGPTGGTAAVTWFVEHVTRRGKYWNTRVKVTHLTRHTL